MLVEFTVKNYRSIKDELVFSMAKAKGGELEGNSFEPDAPGTIPLLKSAAIYGPNAAGKSNVILAMMEMETIVSKSATSVQEGDKISVTPFLFDEASAAEPTELEMIFVNDGIKFQFGFTATSSQIIEEWLIAYPKGRAQRWYSRAFSKKKQKYDYKFSDLLLGQKSVWRDATRSNALFLSTAVQLNSEQLRPVFNWFKKTLRPVHVGGWWPSFTASLCEQEDSKSKVLEFLKAADVDIHDIKLDKEKFDPDILPDDLPNNAKKKLIKEMKGKDVVNIMTIHRSTSGKLVPLDFDAESDGTKKFFSFAGPWLDSLSKGYVLVIDELHDNLHPSMVKYLVGLFHNKKTNPKNAQLIFTTHETSILNQDIFRRDQIWFCEKLKDKETSLYPLTDFSPRKNRENIEQGYLSGRYGALPYIRSFEFEALN
jgi:AAA15 family ATPase/GTPase